MLLIVVAGVLAATTGYLASQAFGAGSQPPVTTTTVTLTGGATGPTGATGPAGPTGPPGPAGGGAEDCPAGSTFTAVVLNHPGGHVTLWVCVAD